MAVAVVEEGKEVVADLEEAEVVAEVVVVGE